MTEEFSEDGVKRALVSNSNTVALLSFVISIIGFFVPLIVAFGLLGRGTSSTSAALGSVFSSKKSNKNQVLSFIKNKSYNLQVTEPIDSYKTQDLKQEPQH